MNWIQPSKKQIAAMSWWTKNSDYEGIIADGSIRAGKTLALSVGFIAWAMENFENCNFAICGKTVTSCKKNVIDPLIQALQGLYKVQYKNTENCLFIGTNRFYVYGGKDESSQSLIQGITLAGILLDEVALMPESFVNQATGRCSVDGSKLWFNCNPETPRHWFYEKWIKKARKRKLLHLHFTMEDNPSLSEKIKQRYRAMYDGVFYDRFIRGLWVAAEGLVYPMFNRDFHVVPVAPRPYEQYQISLDYGIQNATAMELWGLAGGTWYLVNEYYHSGRETGQQKTDDEYYQELEKLAGDLKIRRVIVDPSAASFIALIRRKGKFAVSGAENDVLDGIRSTATALKLGLVRINECCKHTIDEFYMYVWDEKAIGEDRPVKDNDHTMDAVRYFVYINKLALPRRKNRLIDC